MKLTISELTRRAVIAEQRHYIKQGRAVSITNPQGREFVKCFGLEVISAIDKGEATEDEIINLLRRYLKALKKKQKGAK